MNETSAEVYDLFPQGCRLGDRCKFEHKFSDETEDEVERRAQSVSNQPLQFMRSLAPGEQLRIRVISWFICSIRGVSPRTCPLAVTAKS